MPIKPKNSPASDKAPSPQTPAAEPVVRQRQQAPFSSKENQSPDRESEKPRPSSNWNEDGSYKVGKGRPPVDRRFQPGQSGNPKGRRKGQRNLDTLVIATMQKTIVVTGPQGAKRKISQLDALVLKLYEKAIKGDLRAAHLLLDWYVKATERKAIADAPDEGLSAAEQEMLQSLFRGFSSDAEGASA